MKCLHISDDGNAVAAWPAGIQVVHTQKQNDLSTYTVTTSDISTEQKKQNMFRQGIKIHDDVPDMRARRCKAQTESTIGNKYLT